MAAKEEPAEIELPELRTFTVFESRVGTKVVLAWCSMGAGPGFTDIAYTEADGFTPAEFAEGAPAPNLERYLFTVAECPQEYDTPDLRYPTILAEPSE